jgi:peptidoglycan/LPS O-acetylase OafA/YrhL
VFFYFLTPFLLFGLHKIRVREKVSFLLILLLLVFACEVSLAYMVKNNIEPYSIGWWFIYISPWVRVFDYNAGLITGLVFISIRADSQVAETKRMLFSFLEVMALVVFAGSIYYSRFVSYGSLIYSAYYVPFPVILIFVYSFQKGWTAWLLSRNIFSYLGGLSFTFYMLHQIIISYTAVFFTPSIFLLTLSHKHLIAQLLLLVNIVFLSDISFRYFEIRVRKKDVDQTWI